MIKKQSKDKPLNKAAVLAKQRLEEIERLKKEEERLKKEEDDRIELENRLENERKQEEERLKEQKRLKKEEKIRLQKESGTYKTVGEKKREKEKNSYMSRGITSSSTIISKEEIKEEIVENSVRAPIICVLGHVDTGKTKLLDSLRRTNIGGKEEANITQQIGGSFLSKSRIPEECEVPGFFFIDTPGHTSFGNLRSRGSKICDLAILVVDIMHGIEKQTIESIEICKKEGVPFIVALNKIDRIYEWNSDTNNQQFQSLKTEIFSYFWNNQYNTRLYFEEQTENCITFVPISALTGEGLENLLISCSDYCMNNIDLSICEELEATVMEVRKTNRGETSLDVILKNGKLEVGDLIGISTNKGRTVTRIRSLQIAEECEEMRMTKHFNSLNKVVGSCGVKILANDLEGTIPGIPLIKLQSEDEVFEVFESTIELDNEGIAIFAPSLGQLEGLLNHLRNECNISVSIAELGDVYRKKILSMSEYSSNYRFIMCFDVELNEESRIFCSQNNITVIKDATIYRLSSKFDEIMKIQKQETEKRIKLESRIPFKLRIEQSFRNRDPIILQISVEEGELSKNIEITDELGNKLGAISEIRVNDSPVEFLEKGHSGTICIQTNLLFGRNLTLNSELYPILTRESLESLKEHFKEKITPEMFRLIQNIKRIQKIENGIKKTVKL